MIWEAFIHWIELYIFALLIIVYMLSRNEIKQIQKIYVMFQMAALLWPFGQFSLNLTENTTYQWVYLNISFFGILLVSYLWLTISFLFTSRFNQRRKFYIRLAALPMLIIAIGVSLNPVHGWFAKPLDGNFIYRDYGPMFWVMAYGALSYVVVGCVLMLLSIRGREGSMKKQALLLFLGQLLLLVFWTADVWVNSDSTFKLSIIPGLTSCGIMISYMFFAVAVQKYSGYKVVALAHDAVIDSMDSGLIVLNDRNIIIEMNHTSRRFISAKLGQSFPIDSCIDCMDPQDSEDFLHVYKKKPKASIQAELSSFTPSMEHVLMRIHPLTDRKQRLLGRIITFQDVSAWRSMVEELNVKNEDLRLRNQELTIIQEELYGLNKQLELMATTDSLTGCYNRRYLFQIMEYQISVDKRYPVPFSLILLDIDYFKQTNDTYGHQIGDIVLQQTAELISSRLRKTDIFARYGGEEFAIFLPYTKREYAIMLAEQLRSLVEDNIVETEYGQIRITISVGIASSEDSQTTDVEDVKGYISELIEKADTALYRAKNQGRNQIAAASEAIG